jgi:lysophospholipase L1-like esterase
MARGAEDPCVPAPQSKEWFPEADWLARHDALLAASRQNPESCELVFLGDSITEGWAGEGWEQRYAQPHGALNLGIGGDEVQHLTWRVQHGELDAISPAVAVILIGTNNIGNVGHKASPVAAGVRLLLDELRAKLPATKLLLLATFPRDPQPGTAFRQEVSDLNAVLRTFRDGQHIFFLDVGPAFFADKPDFVTTFRETEVIQDDVMPDYLHLSSKGYQIWADTMSPILQRLLGAPPQLPPEDVPYLTRAFEAADLDQVHALFTAGMRFYHDHGISDWMRRGWERYIQHVSADSRRSSSSSSSSSSSHSHRLLRCRSLARSAKQSSSLRCSADCPLAPGSAC